MLNAISWDAVQGVTSSIGVVLACAALIYSVASFKKTLKYVHYDDIDKNYFDLLKIAFEHPFVRTPATIDSVHEAKQYDLYAFMMWNFLEAIYDRCLEDDALKQTWTPIIIAEGRRHLGWLREQGNAANFKSTFLTYVEKTVAP